MIGDELSNHFSGRNENAVDNSVIFSNQILIINLAIADFLMGIYLCCVSMYAYIFSGKYCAVYINWLTGNTCQFLGVLMMLSSEVSIFTLVMLASLRMMSIMRVSLGTIHICSPNKILPIFRPPTHIQQVSFLSLQHYHPHFG